MRSRLFLRATLLTAVSLAVAVGSYRVGIGACTEDCDKDRCLYRFISSINTHYLIDSAHDLDRFHIDCYLDFWTDSSSDMYAVGDGGWENARYQVIPNAPSLGGCVSQDDKYIDVDAIFCDTDEGWTANWALICGTNCEQG